VQLQNLSRNNPDKINQSLYMLSTIRKLERVGDQSKNIAEEIIFLCGSKKSSNTKKISEKNQYYRFITE
jgi:phosphate transport system protein